MSDTETADARPVLMSRFIAERLGIRDRWTVVSSMIYEGGSRGSSGIAYVTEAELLAAGASRVEWGEPDENGGWYVPTLYSNPLEPLP